MQGQLVGIHHDHDDDVRASRGGDGIQPSLSARHGGAATALQMGGIDESALDRLSLVTEMTRHIRVKTGGGAEAARAQAAGPCSR